MIGKNRKSSVITITNLIEDIFLHATALAQSGSLWNAIYALEREIYIFNYDHTVLLRFRLRDTESAFSHPISFRANDYDSNKILEEDGRIVFITHQGDFQKKKICGKAEFEPDEIRSLCSHFLSLKDHAVEKVTLDKDLLSFLNPYLNHIEFSGKKGGYLKMVQRNIYDGGIVEIQEQSKSIFASDTLKNDFGPVGLKTNDFKALFTFLNTLEFQFPANNQEDFILVRSVDKNKRDMVGVLACCLYDEIIQIKEVRNGRQEQEDVRSK
jgi:hypothetical protein